MLKIYGSMLCKDCVDCREAFDKSGVVYEFLDFSHDLRNLKEFLLLRDSRPEFTDIRRTDCIGIPCIVSDDSEISLDWTEYVGQDLS